MTEDTPQEQDAELVRAASAGDTKAFEALVRRHIRQVRTFVALRAPVSHLVDEISHETFVFAHRHLGEFTPGTSLCAWLRAIASNLLRAELQRYARERVGLMNHAERLAVEEGMRVPGPDRSGPEAEALEECVRGLPPVSRQLLQLKYGDAMESDVIAGVLQRSTAWVRTTLFRLRKSLRTCVEQRISLADGGRP